MQLVPGPHLRCDRARHAPATQFTGVFSLGTPITTPYQRAMAAVLATGGLLSHEWCRWLFGVGRLPRHDPDVTVTGNRRSRDGLTLHRTRAPLIADMNHGIPCTRPERMVIDCASHPTCAAWSTTSRSRSSPHSNPSLPQLKERAAAT